MTSAACAANSTPTLTTRPTPLSTETSRTHLVTLYQNVSVFTGDANKKYEIKRLQGSEGVRILVKEEGKGENIYTLEKGANGSSVRIDEIVLVDKGYMTVPSNWSTITRYPLFQDRSFTLTKRNAGKITFTLKEVSAEKKAVVHIEEDFQNPLRRNVRDSSVGDYVTTVFIFSGELQHLQGVEMENKDGILYIRFTPDWVEIR